MKHASKAARAAKRRLAILAFLHTSPRSYEALLASLRDTDLLDDHADSTDDTLRFQFRHDLQALRLSGCQIDYDRTTRKYVWYNSPFGLSFNFAQLQAFALILATFEGSPILYSTAIEDLLSYLTTLLPPEQKETLGKKGRSFSIDLHATTDYRNADHDTVKFIEMAIERKQQLEFRYRSPREEVERAHIIEPRPLIYQRGHVYLWGWSLEANKELQYRLDHVVPGSARVLPTRALPNRPKEDDVLLRYRLKPVLVRGGISKHFPNQQVETHDDGCATVTVVVPRTMLFEAKRLFLSYGQNCTVLAPPELVEEIKSVIGELYKIYHTTDE